MARTRKSRARKKPRKLAIPKFGGDHGTGTAAATEDTVIEALENDQGKNPNNMGRRRRKSAIEAISLTMRQEQAARAIETAWCRLKALESGGPLKEHVDASPKPDAVVARQVDAHSYWIHVTRQVPRHAAQLVHWVCCMNKPITQWGRATGEVRAVERFKDAMDIVADHLRY